MMKKINFISGLPRSGSTLLSSILNQNPRFSAGITDPLHSFCHSIIRDLNSSVGIDVTFDDEMRKKILSSLFNSYYENKNEICFNTNRAWTSDTSLLKHLFPNFKMIVCYRSIPWILDSFEVLNRKNPYTLKPLYHHLDLNSVYQRTHMLMGGFADKIGYVSSPLECMVQAVYSEDNSHICYVEYEALAKKPNETMKKIYEFIDEPWFEHDFDNVESSYDEFDIQTKLKGLHKVKKKVEYIERSSILPMDLFNQYEQVSFWKDKNFLQIKNKLNWIDYSSVTNLNNKRQL